MAGRSDEMRQAHWKQLNEHVAVQQDIASRLRDGRMQTHSRDQDGRLVDTTEASARHCDHIVATLQEVIDEFYGDFGRERR